MSPPPPRQYETGENINQATSTASTTKVCHRLPSPRLPKPSPIQKQTRISRSPCRHPYPPEETLFVSQTKRLLHASHTYFLHQACRKLGLGKLQYGAFSLMRGGVFDSALSARGACVERSGRTSRCTWMGCTRLQNISPRTSCLHINDQPTKTGQKVQPPKSF